MTTVENVLNWIYECIDETNLLLAKDRQINKSQGTALFGEESMLDSLTFINLIIAVEEKILQETNVELIIMGSETFYQETDQLNSVENLANFIFRELHA